VELEMKGFIRAITFALAVAVAVSVAVSVAHAEDDTRDFYAEPGMNIFRTSAGQDATENIDPFSGNLQLSYVDLSIPGNGGLDINVTRYYNLPQSSPGYANPFGYGWTMHFGRITIGSGHANQLCSAGDPVGGDTLNNPSIEMPSGGRELLVHSSVLNDGSYVTKSNWKAKCIDPTDYKRGIVATAPDGTAYYMREYVFMQGEDGPAGETAPTVETWLTTQIVDSYGNSLDISYLGIASGMQLATRIEASDGRQVTFEYLDTNDTTVTANSVNARLSAIKSNGQTWSYQYDSFKGGSTGWSVVDHYKLTAVVRPDGTRWHYEYGAIAGEPEFNRLTNVIYPAGGEINYSYQKVQPYLPQPDFSIFAIAAKTQINPGHPVGTWIYEFYPGSVDFADLGVQPVSENAGRMADFTRITTPLGVEHLYHVGYWALVGTHDILWQMGLKIRHQYLALDTSDGSLNPVRSLSNSWSFRTISDEVYRGGVLSALWDSHTYAPMLAHQTVVIDGYAYATRYSNHDLFGNPGRSTQYSIYPTENSDRITETSYQNHLAGWFIGLPETETVSQDGTAVGSVHRVYNERGRLETENRFGVETHYSYNGEGELASVTDARGHTTVYGDYFRGIARREELPDGSQRNRAVNPTGTVASRTSGRGHLTAFTYDDLNRLTGIDYPTGSRVSIDWRANGKTLTRGTYRENADWDGFGREIRSTRKDLGSGDTYESTFDYDAAGRKVFASDVNSVSGIGWEYDVIGRVTRVINQDGTYKTISHEGAHRELHRDENNNLVDYRFQVYGAPENRFLSWTISPEGVVTHTGRDAYGNITSVFQGSLDPENPQQYLGYLQSFGYNTRLQLTSVDSPADIGLTLYGRDIMGNMTSRQVGASNATDYSYDALNRIAAIDYVDDALDVGYSYNADGMIESTANSFASRAYQYDANGGLVTEDFSIGDATYQLSYARDELDNVQLVTYPSGRTLDYAPNALGWPMQALPYVTGVSYHADGSLQQLSYANGRILDVTTTSRNQVDSIALAGIVGLEYGYDPAGNVTSITDALSATSDRAMTYDGLHRVTAVVGYWGMSNYEYDVFSNIVRKADPANSNRSQYFTYTGLLLDQISYSDAAAQRGFSYDDYGNISFSDDAIYDPFTGAPVQVLTARQHLFNDAGNLVFSRRTGRDNLGQLVPSSSGSFSSEYDGENHRVAKINHSDGNHITQYVYSEAGLLMGEYDQAGSYYGNEYFYLGNRQIATAKTNSPPRVDAGDDLQAYGGLTVELSATQSDLDGEIASVEWTQMSGPAVIIDNPASSNTTFVAPGDAGGSTIVLRYTVTDDRGAVATQLVTVEVAVNHPPTADAGPDLNVLAGDTVVLVGSGSFDPDGPISFHWTGSYLTDSTLPDPRIEFPESGQNYSSDYTLTVTDDHGATAVDTVTVNVFTLRSDADLDGLPDGWEVIHFGDTTAFGGSDDPDGDGVDNTREFINETDPNVADSPVQVKKLAVIQGDGQNVLVWQRTPAADQFTVHWSTDPHLPVGAWNQESVTERFFEHGGLNNGLRYYYAVRASNAVGSAVVSPVASGIPGSHSWRTGTQQPDPSASFANASTWIASNRFGDTVILSEKFEEAVYRLYVWQYAIADGWVGPELASEDISPHHFAALDIDDNANVLVTWAGGTPGERNLYATYRPHTKTFGPRETVEHYPAEGDADGDIVGLSHLEFSDDGRAYLCWRQNRLHEYNGLADASGASALLAKFDPLTGWSGERNLEVLNNLGDTSRLSCDVSGDGKVVAAWERLNTFDPQPSAPDATEYDVWVAAYSPDLGWTSSETVEFLHDGRREASGSGAHNHAPRVAVNSRGKAAVIWFNGSEVDIQSIEFDFATAHWLSQETLESRSSQIPDSNSHRIASNANGDMLVSWGDKFRIRNAGTTQWAKSKPLPAAPGLLGVDESGSPYSISVSGTDLIASRQVDGAWVSRPLDQVLEVAGKIAVGAGVHAANVLAVHWLSGASLFFASDEPGAAPPAGNWPPLAEAGSGQEVLEGTSVQMNGSVSHDVDGFISSYLWEQVSGPTVTLLTPTSQFSGFNAPLVDAREDLVVRLTVTDNKGASASATVTITVLDDAPDTTPPATSFSTRVKKVKGANRHSITLVPDETAATRFRFEGQGVITSGGVATSGWQSYTGPVVVQLEKNGSGDFGFYSEDVAGNAEVIQSEVLQ